MIYKLYYLAIGLRLAVFALSSVAVFFFALEGMWAVMVASSVLLLLFALSIIRYINGINRELTFFFDAVRNEDSSLWFVENLKNKSLRELHQSMNRLNQRISEIKIQNEHNEKFFRELLRYSTTGLLAVDNRGIIEVINDAALKLIGLEYIAHIDLIKQQNAALYDILVKITPGRGHTYKLIVNNELRLLSIKVSIFIFGNRKYRIFSIHDIQPDIEDNQIDTWQKLIRILTHEIMNSVAPITSLCNTLGKFVTVSGRAKPADSMTDADITGIITGLLVIEDRGRGLMHFVDDYRRLTKLPKPVFSKVNIDEWLDSNLLLLGPQLKEEKVELKLMRNHQKTEFPGDAKLLSQVFINLVNNALDAVKENTEKKILIKTSDNPGGNHVIHIADNGRGIAADDLEKIFIPFYTTKENGSGIGLSLSQQIMRMHKGKLSVRSVPGRQTVFTIMF